MSVELESFSKEELLRILKRDRFVKEQQAVRVGQLTQQVDEMLGIIQELQSDLALARQTTAATSNGEVGAEPAVVQ